VKILVTAGPTREYFDSVRFISNPSSGKMGYAIAAAAAARGHQVVLISGPVQLDPPAGVQTIRVVSSAEMAEQCKAAWPSCDVALMTAAVCDYRPAKTLIKKLKKSNKPRHVTLLPTEDIAGSLGAAKRPGQILVTFAMEDHDAHRHAEQKMRRKRSDVVVLNGPANIGSDQALVEVLVAGEGWKRWRRAHKAAVADRLVRLAERLARRSKQHHTKQRRP